jgi:hypothetical protein
LLAGVVFVFGEHIWVAEPVRPFLSAAGVLLLLLSLAWNVWEARAVGQRTLKDWALGPALASAVFLLSAGLYGLGLLIPAQGGSGIDWASILGWSWMLTLIAGIVLYIFLEAAWSRFAGPGGAGARRLQSARHAALSLGLLLLLVITLNFVFEKLSWQWDVGYFRTALPGDATRETLKNLDAPLTLAAFFPAGNPVLTLVKDYLSELEGVSSQLQIGYYDSDLNPEEAKRFKARRNGVIVVAREGLQRDLSLGLTPDAAGNKLTKLDANLLAKITEVTRAKRTAYLTVGHGERNEAAQNELPTGSRVKGLEAILRAQNYQTKPFGFTDGLGTEVPDKADLVLVVGPRLPFRPEEEATLGRYLEHGGKLMVFLEPDAGSAPGLPVPVLSKEPPLSRLLERYGLRLIATVQANDRVFGRRTQTKADHALLATNRYQSHPSVNSLRRSTSQFPLLFLGTGAFEKTDPPPNLSVKETVKGMPGTWSDTDGNFEFDEKREKRREPILVAAVGPKTPPKKPAKDAPAPPPAETPLPRLIAFADADVASDLLIQNRANQLVLLDGIAWLAGDAAPASAPTEEEDLKIQHLKGDELIWFYLPVFAVPLLVLLAGLGISRRIAGRPEGGGRG